MIKPIRIALAALSLTVVAAGGAGGHPPDMI